MTWVPTWLPWHGGDTYNIRSVLVAWVGDGEFVLFWTASDGRTDGDGEPIPSSLFSQRGTVATDPDFPPEMTGEVTLLADYDRPMLLRDVERTPSGRFAIRLYSPSES